MADASSVAATVKSFLNEICCSTPHLAAQLLQELEPDESISMPASSSCRSAKCRGSGPQSPLLIGCEGENNEMGDANSRRHAATVIKVFACMATRRDGTAVWCGVAFFGRTHDRERQPSPTFSHDLIMMRGVYNQLRKIASTRAAQGSNCRTSAHPSHSP